MCDGPRACSRPRIGIAIVVFLLQGGLIPYNRDAMPLDVRDPFVFCVFPRALRSDGRTVNFEPLFHFRPMPASRL